jgi:DUF1680 family protein
MAAAAFAGAAASVPLAATPAHAARPDTGVSVFAFPLGAVQLLPSLFASNTGRAHAYINFLDLERMLHTFRLNVGLPTSAAAMGGWETPTTELRGHSMGHLMSALAQAYASTGTATFKTRGDYLVAELAKCQARAAAVGFNTGYLSAYPESFIDRVEARQTVWAPYYTLHKIMAGLLDMHLLAGNAQALQVLNGMAAWTKFRNDRLTQTQRQNMLDTEFGGMNEVLTNLYQLTADPNHLVTAQYFDHAEIFDPLASNVDQLAGYHANTQIPKITGAIREYHATGTTRYRDIAVNFWDIVTRRHSYAIGGNSNGEYFRAPDRIASELSDSTCESCNSYNMLKLTRQLFFTNPARTDYMDFYEKNLYNHILGAQNPNVARHAHCYYIPLRPGGQKTYSNDYNNWTCCHGTGMESHTKHGNSIYFFSGTTLYVNLFVPSVLTWAERGITVRQENTYPESTSTRLTVTGSGAFTMRIRIPAWTSGPSLRVNGAAQAATPGTYATINRTWASGDVVDLTLPMALTRESTPDSATTQAVRYGPIVLSGSYGTNNLSALPTLQPATIASTATPLQFTATATPGPSGGGSGAVTLIPFYKMHGQRYTVYWNVPGSSNPLPEFVAHYRFDETSGTTAADATGGGRTATLAGGAGWVAGRQANAVNLTGSGAHVALPSGILAGANAFTVAAWVRLDTRTGWARLFDFGAGTATNMFFTPQAGTGAARFAITNGGAGAEQRINLASPLATGVWTHVAVTQTGNLGVVYLNGAEAARNTALTVRPANLGTTTQNWIGRSQYSGDPYLDGAVDNFRIYSRALTAAEVSALFSGGQ